MAAEGVRQGRLIVLGVIAVVALTEVTLSGFQLAAGRYRPAHLGRLVLTAWLLWQIWDGAVWARRVTVALLGLATVAGIIFLLLDRSPAALLSMGALAAVCAALAAVLALSSSVDAFQASQRAKRPAEQ